VTATWSEGRPAIVGPKGITRGFHGGGVDSHERTTPVRRVGQSEDVAAACAFLVRDEAGYLTGQVLGVNGGRTTA
jgi:2-hydroxycyclohexanecarboxyl-CoA dehydrogenase